jgi:hypothetical protein
VKLSLSLILAVKKIGLVAQQWIPLDKLPLVYGAVGSDSILMSASPRILMNVRYISQVNRRKTTRMISSKVKLHY